MSAMTLKKLAGTALVFPILCSGVLAQDDMVGNTAYIPDGYRLEAIALPADVPFHATGLDINEAGAVAVATRLGDVWILDADAAAGTPQPGDWQLFAEGLNEPTGLMWEDDGTILVGQKSELTRLVDKDGDGVADDYLNLASDWDFHDNYHEYNFAPVRDGDGNLVGTLNLGHNVPGGYSWGERPVMVSAGGHRGWAYRITPDGDFSFFASGLRSPAGVGVSPDGLVYYTDNQGDWVPTSKLHILEDGAFYGHPSSLRDHPDYSIPILDDMSVEDFAQMSETPVVWIPHQEVANSPGNPEWDTTGGAFGPFEGQIFVGDQTQSNVFRILLETVNGQRQGAVINFANNFQSGNIRLAFHPGGDLWVGQTARGWGAVGSKPFGIERVVWDGETQPFELLDIAMTADGFRLDFTGAVDPASLSASAFSIQQWGYDYSDAYGSDKIDLTSLETRSVDIADDGLSVSIGIDQMPGTVMAIDFSALRSADGRKPSVSKVYYTVNTTM
ncbi:DUF7133 domain-containing protein [Aquisalinus flavus]|uniref:DUF7133 domain-containing protein n=1 Tax=Aquisalinus flavus TaxID=1526572 RepID=A0A8J2Y3X4_9PROT|nr:hypothetical protein [Aquisalinus flavus]GGD11133.1 hypothetical protein GCM10011342_19910 [Aquisalinus flavus]